MSERTGAPDEVLRVESHGNVALLVLNRPERRNAMNVELCEAMCSAVVASQAAGAIVITGTDPAFCSGTDLRLGDDRWRLWPGPASQRQIAPYVAAVAESTVPVICAVNGPAVTGGLEMAVTADFVVASERASFADTHLRVGHYPPETVMIDLSRRVGAAQAREMDLTSNFVDASTALRIGLANHVVAHDQLIPFALRLAESIAEVDRGMVAAMRREWQLTDALPLDPARRIHAEFMQRFEGGADAFNDEQVRDAVLRRSAARLDDNVRRSHS